MRFLSFVGRRDNERRKIAQCERAADNRLSLTRQRASCWTDSKIESVQQLLNESERSLDQRRIVRASERQDMAPVASTDQSLIHQDRRDADVTDGKLLSRSVSEAVACSRIM